ncbi:hypothetical protein BCR35DRAFT_307658 [Leucosporidium creatinivorum]|uniref:Mitochondrial ATP synthase g subunit-domain-containing protein n=1 Tax=Leucosporidium creatinivorum TaxID=106004 RepID=A0A1Y2ELH5_9BASI|nr:hypothetical protein BCR35DRAFT_307658 [Leucosporidium creatinivorum]
MFSRSLIRSTLRLQVRQASTASAEQQAKQGAQKVAGGAKEGAQAAAEKVQAAAGPYLEKAQKLAGSVGTTVGNSLGAYKEPIFYNAAVAKELVKQVYVAEKMSPPSVSQFTYTYSQFFNNAKNPSFWQKLYTSGEWKRVAIYAVEAYGVFKIGEMIGRR